MIVVTGANGFIGSAMVWELNNVGQYDVVCVDSVNVLTRPGPLRHRRFKDFFLKDELWAFLERPETKKNLTAIIHMGACSTTTEMNVAFLTENNFEYTKRIWKWCVEHKKTLIYASSAAVYGDGSKSFDDALPSKIFAPLNPYGESKACFDRWVEDEILQGKPTPPKWFGLRFFNVFGPNEYHKEFMRSVVNKAFAQIQESGSLTLFRSHDPKYENGKQMRDFVYVKDITRWMLELLNAAVPSGIYNMGFGEARTWLDLSAAVFKAMGLTINITWTDIPEVMRARYQYFTQAKMDRLMATGLSKPQWPVEKAAEDYVINYLSKPLEMDTYL